MVKRTTWTENEIDELPLGENNEFDRKSGLLFDRNRGDFFNTIGKELSAFANSGGGHLLLGVKDDGCPDGLPPLIGHTSIKDWLEQKIPNLVDYPLSDFRVHIVARSVPSRVPIDREVVVIDIGDSALAPHQSVGDRKYYYRSAGRSEPAPHFYLELLRQRLTNPTLEFALEEVNLADASQIDDGIFLETKMVFLIKNTGRIAAYKWGLFLNTLLNIPDDREKDYFVGAGSFPVNKRRDRSIRMDDTILPGGEIPETRDLGFMLRPQTLSKEHLLVEIVNMISNIGVECQLATETSPGQLKSQFLESLVKPDEVVEFLLNHTKGSSE